MKTEISNWEKIRKQKPKASFLKVHRGVDPFVLYVDKLEAMGDAIQNENILLQEFRNSVGHALIDYYHVMGLDSIDFVRGRKKAMEKIQLADNKLSRLLEGLNTK